MAETCLYHEGKVSVCQAPATHRLAIFWLDASVSVERGEGATRSYCVTHAEGIAAHLRQRQDDARRAPKRGKVRTYAVLDPEPAVTSAAVENDDETLVLASASKKQPRKGSRRG